ncbi:MAG: orotidine 5'-phosphate decarboxylase [Thermoplasmata archaeon]|nr:orotidine 5'-phosphate decarboxylase [Thermoplasmata archaeon]
MTDDIKLQVALDLIQGQRALQIAKEAVAGGAHWIEAGTPLIKSEGMDIIRQLKASFPDNIIVADMKTMDVGGLEVEMATRSGADVVAVMGISDDGTITEAVKSASQYGSKIMVDLMSIENPEVRVKELEGFGVDILCVHVSIDHQMRGGKPFDIIKDLSRITELPIAVAGGINSETAPEAIRNGASIIIVGGAIIKARDVTAATRHIVESINTLEPAETPLFKKYDEGQIREALEKVSTPNIADAMHREGAMFEIRPFVNKGRKMIGRALTVRTMDGDWAKPVEAIDLAGEGDIIVIDAGRGNIAVWGELASCSCKEKKISGVVIDGAIRDVDAILEMDFPAFARHSRACAGEPKGYGEIGCDIVCGGQKVKNGDWLVGDETGVIVIPARSAVEIANRALDVFERENRIREEIQRGSTLSKVLELSKWEKSG